MNRLQIVSDIALLSKNEMYPLPRYWDDLNAMHDAEKVLHNDHNGYGSWVYYRNILAQVIGSHAMIVHATAAQKAEAFLKCFNKWTELEPSSPIAA